MDPERLQRLLARVRDLRAEGVSDRKIDSALRRRDDIPINSVRSALQLGEVEGLVGPQGEFLFGDEADQTDDSPLQKATPFINDAFFGAGDEILAGLEKVGLAREGAAERFQGDVDEAREENPVIQGAAGLVGLLGGTPGRLAAKGVGAAGRAGANLLGRGSRAATRAAGGGPLTQVVTEQAGRSVGSLLGGGTAAGAEGGLFGALSAPSDASAEERGDRAVSFGVPSALIGGPATSLVTGVRGLRSIRAATREGGERLADAAQRQGRLRGTQKVENLRQNVQQRSSQAFQEAESVGTQIPGELTDFAAQNPTIRRVLQSSSSQQADDVLARLNKLQQGEAARPLSFEEADAIRSALRDQADRSAQARATLGDRVSDPFEAAEAQSALNQLEGFLEQVPGFERGMKLSASQNAIRRAADFGKKLTGSSVPPETVERALSGGRVRLGKNTFQATSLAERSAVREALANPVIRRLRGGESNVQSFLNEANTSSDMQRRLRQILGSEERLAQFLDEAERLEALGQAGKVADALIKTASFFGVGSSAFAGGLLEFF